MLHISAPGKALYHPSPQPPWQLPGGFQGCCGRTADPGGPGRARWIPGARPRPPAPMHSHAMATRRDGVRSDARLCGRRARCRRVTLPRPSWQLPCHATRHAGHSCHESQRTAVRQGQRHQVRVHATNPAQVQSASRCRNAAHHSTATQALTNAISLPSVIRFGRLTRPLKGLVANSVV
jgi:hypothetical protein